MAHHVPQSTSRTKDAAQTSVTTGIETEVDEVEEARDTGVIGTGAMTATTTETATGVIDVMIGIGTLGTGTTTIGTLGNATRTATAMETDAGIATTVEAITGAAVAQAAVVVVVVVRVSALPLLNTRHTMQVLAANHPHIRLLSLLQRMVLALLPTLLISPTLLLPLPPLELRLRNQLMVMARLAMPLITTLRTASRSNHRRSPVATIRSSNSTGF